MTIQLHPEQCELRYEGTFMEPRFQLTGSPGKLCDLLLNALNAFGCTSADLAIESGEPSDRGVTCEVDELDSRVTVYGDRVEVYCEDFLADRAAGITAALSKVWSGLSGVTGIVAGKHSFCSK